MNVCRGHERSVDCLDVSPAGSLLASGSFDTTLKIWGTKVLPGGGEDEDADAEDAHETGVNSDHTEKGALQLCVGISRTCPTSYRAGLTMAWVGPFGNQNPDQARDSTVHMIRNCCMVQIA